MNQQSTSELGAAIRPSLAGATTSLALLLASTAAESATAAAKPVTAAAVPVTASERALHAEVIVNAPLQAVWQAWSTNEGVRSFMAPKANIDLRIGGAYEIFFNPADDRMSTKGMKVLAYIPGEMLAFEWCLPKDEFPQFKDSRGWVVVQLSPIGASQTRVRVTHLGWGQGAEWDRAYAHMERGWTELTQRLAARFEKGPMDWQAQQMMWKERAAAPISQR